MGDMIENVALLISLLILEYKGGMILNTLRNLEDILKYIFIFIFMVYFNLFSVGILNTFVN
jgi:hypothetical protein